MRLRRLVVPTSVLALALALAVAAPASADTTYRFTVTNTNRAPVVGDPPPPFAVEGSLYSATLDVTDADGDALTFELQSGPAGAAVSSTQRRLVPSATTLCTEMKCPAGSAGSGWLVAASG